MSPSPHQLFFIADHLNLLLLERQRAVALNLEADKQDGDIARSLSTLRTSIEELEQQQLNPSHADPDLARLRRQYDDLNARFRSSVAASSDTTTPDEPSSSQDSAAAQTRPQAPRRNKSVRFRDDPDAEEDPVDTANRNALFADQERYRDEPPRPDQSDLSNLQIHDHHKQVLRDQDEQLDTLGQSVKRQRILGIQMGDEIDEQNELLEDVESGVDRHQNTLTRARQRLGTVARKSKANWSWLTIAILIIVLILLIAVLK